MNAAALTAAKGGVAHLGRLVWQPRGADVVCVLPSGRPLVYRDVAVEMRPTKWGTDELTFTYARHGQRIGTYGGKLTENVTQAICRDVLAEALVRLERAKTRVVLHVHDEIVAELNEEAELAKMDALVRQAPTWAQSLPFATVSFAATRYRK